MPEVAEDFVSRYGDQSLTGFLDSMGAMAPTAQRKFEHYEDDWIHQSFVNTGTPTVTQAGATVGINTSYSSTGSAAGNYFPRVGDIVMNKNGDLAWCSAINYASDQIT